ncbi:unnamed protein product [Rotaria sordida]|uniref:Uncharacterized protein n=1 Tax=Rotaria sordida TaxID=392033 RepID=A0A819AAH2_9BILA|nr:unnamed protein product [Rotaria sordida]
MKIHLQDNDDPYDKILEYMTKKVIHQKGYYNAASLATSDAANMTLQRQIKQIHEIIVDHKMKHLSNLSIYPSSHLVNFFSHITSSRYNIDIPLLKRFFERLNSFDNQTLFSLLDVNNL